MTLLGRRLSERDKQTASAQRPLCRSCPINSLAAPYIPKVNAKPNIVLLRLKFGSTRFKAKPYIAFLKLRVGFILSLTFQFSPATN